jgi:hypothetical protein
VRAANSLEESFLAIQIGLEFLWDLVQKDLKRFISQFISYGGGAKDASLFKPPLPFLGGLIYELLLTLPWCPTSLNKTLRTHYFKRGKANHAWNFYIAGFLHGKKPPQPLKQAHLRIVRHSHRALDFDGLVGSMKPVVDALVTAGVLADDSWKVLGAWEVDQVFRPKAQGQLLEIHVGST